MTKHAVIAACLAGLMLGACGNGRTNYHEFDGYAYSGSARGAERGSAAFTATVRGVSRSLEGARQAVAYEAVQYCVTTFGTSDIVWTHAPDAEQAALQIDGDSLTVAGTCVE